MGKEIQWRCQMKEAKVAWYHRQARKGIRKKTTIKYGEGGLTILHNQIQKLYKLEGIKWRQHTKENW